MTRWIVAGYAAAFSLLAAPSARAVIVEPATPDNAAAAPSPAAPVVDSPSVITDCLCQAARVRSFHIASDNAQRDFDAGQARVSHMKDQTDQARQSLDPNDAGQVDAFRRLLGEQQDEEEKVAVTLRPKTEDAVRRYNDEAKSYNAQCTGKSFDATVMKQIQTRLVCPRLVPKDAQASP